MPTFDLATLVAEIKQGTTDIQLLVDHHSAKLADVARLNAQINAIENRNKLHAARITRLDALLADTNSAYYLSWGAAGERQREISVREVTNYTTKLSELYATRDTEQAELETIYNEILSIRIGHYIQQNTVNPN